MQIMKTSHYLKKAGAVCMAAAMMTGCASGSSGANGKTLTVGLNTGFNGIFSPLYYQTVYDDYVIEMVYQSMLSYDRDNQLQPELATEQPTISEDGSTLTFKLKKGVKFSDGSKLDADDVVLTFTAMADPSYTGRFSTYVDYLEGYKEYHEGDAETLSGVEKIDDKLMATGGRVLVCVGFGKSIKEARDRAYALCGQVHFAGKKCRTDIAYQALK